MSFAALDWAFELAVEGPQKAVLLALARHADDAGRCYPSVPRLCRLAGVHERAARTAIAKLETLGAIIVDRSTGGRKSSDYVLNLDFRRDGAPPNGAAGVHKMHRKPRPNGAAEVHDVHLKPVEVHLVHPKDPPEVHEMHPKPQPEVHEMPPSPVRGARDAPPGVHEMHPNLHMNLSKGRKGSESARGAPPALLPPALLPKDWQPNAEEERYATDLGLGVRLVAEKFANWQWKRGNRSPDWTAAWKVWCLDQVERDADHEARAGSRRNPFVVITEGEGMPSVRRNGHNREDDAGVRLIAGMFGHA